MPKPLVSTDPNPPKDVRFSHFGVLDDGHRSKGATITSIVINGTILLVILILGAAIKNNPTLAKQIADVYLPPKPPEIIKPKPPPPPPPKPLPKPPEIKIQPPKIKMPDPVKLPPDIKPVIVPIPKPPVITPPAPLKVNPPPAPKVVSLAAKPAAASIANNDAHPSPVRLGKPEIKALNGPSVVTPVNLGGGMHGMPASNTGSGPRATSVSLGNGAPSGTDINGKSRGPVKVAGLSTGVPGGTGTGAHGPVRVEIAPPPPPVQPTRGPGIVQATTTSKPTLIYKPEPVYSAEAKALHLEGNVTLHIRILANGSTEVLGVVHGLGHGLDESAVAATKATRFRPAMDSAGHPTDYETNVVVSFQMS